MAKTSVSQWDTTANNNTDINSISLAENVMQPPAVNDAFREMMAQIATGVVVKVAATTTVSAYFQLAEATNNGTNKLTITPTTSLTADRTATFPDLSGTVLYADAAQTVSAVHTFSAVPVMSGGAIQFPATQVASSDANALDDYEEGTFTPAYSSTGATFSYSSQVGTYTKIGNRVTLEWRIALNNTGNTLTANLLTVTGLPFTSGHSVNVQGLVGWAGATTSYVTVQSTISSGTSTLSINGATAASTTNGTPAASNAILSAAGGSILSGTISYKV